MDFLPGVWGLTPLGGVLGMSVTLYWLISSGRLIPRASHEREMTLVRERGDEWKKAALDQQHVNQEIRSQNTALLETARITAKFFGDVGIDVEDTGTRDVGP